MRHCTYTHQQYILTLHPSIDSSSFLICLSTPGYETTTLEQALDYNTYIKSKELIEKKESGDKSISQEKIDKAHDTLKKYEANYKLYDSYLQRFKMDFKDLLTTDIDRAGKDYSEYQNNGCGLGIGGEDISEWIHHIHWCQGKCKTFEGRKHLVQECISHIRKPNRSTISDTDKTINHNPSSSSTPSSKISAIEDTFAGISLAIIGVSGSGKTALVSKVAQELKDDRAFRDIPLVVRFCGTTDHNNDGVGGGGVHRQSVNEKEDVLIRLSSI